MLLAEGVVRSGKSFAAMVGFLLFTQSLDEPYEHLLLAKNCDTAESAIIGPMMIFAKEYLGLESHFQAHKSRLKIGNQLYWLRGAENSISGKSLMGLNIHSGLFDEVAIYDKETFNAGLSRISHEKSKLWLTANPEDPKNFIKTDFIDKGKIDAHYKFTFQDNPSLGEKTIERLTNSFHGVFHSRKILGIWAEFIGKIYPDYRVVKHVPSKIKRTLIGIDPGNARISAIEVLAEHENGKFTFIDEKIIRGKHTDDDIVSELHILSKKYEDTLESVVVDSAAASTIELIKKMPNRKFRIRKSDKNIIRGIRTLGAALKSEKVRIHEHCQNMLKEIEGYVWGSGEKPVKQNDHSLDAGRYLALHLF